MLSGCLMARRTDVQGIRELQRMFQRLGKSPQRVANKAARAGAAIPRKAAKDNAPVDQGDLKKGIMMKKERRVKAGKAVYDIMMNPAMNNVFVKISAEGKRSYYPASQEYGFMTKSGRYIPGFRYLLKALENNDTRIEAKVIDVAKKEITKIMNGG